MMEIEQESFNENECINISGELQRNIITSHLNDDNKTQINERTLIFNGKNEYNNTIFAVKVYDSWIDIMEDVPLFVIFNFIKFIPNKSNESDIDFIFILNDQLKSGSQFRIQSPLHCIINNEGILFNKGNKDLAMIDRPGFPELLLFKRYKKYPYKPLNNAQIFKKCFVYGFIINHGPIKQTKYGNYSKMINIKDNSLSVNDSALQIMFFADEPNQLPNVTNGDIIRIHRFKIESGNNNYKCQGVMELKKNKHSFQAFIVINGKKLDEALHNSNDITYDHEKISKITSDVVTQQSSNNFSFDDIVDPIMIFHLRLGYTNNYQPKTQNIQSNNNIKDWFTINHARSLKLSFNYLSSLPK